MKTRIYNLIILDESGSMSSIKKQAIGGFNETVQTIRHAVKEYPEQSHFVSLVTFNGTATKTVYDRMPVDTVSELNDKTYCPDASTPLYDAMGASLNFLKRVVEPEDKVLVTIITDGEENASREYNGQAIKALVEELKAKEWVFTYIGANQDVEKVAATIAVTNVMNFDATIAGTQAMFAKEKSARASYYSRVSQGIKEEAGKFFEEDDEKS